MSAKRRNQPTIKQLESCLQNLNSFDKPKLELEQYSTPPHIAALVLNTIHSTYGDIEGKFVCDLGCGTGRLSVGSLMCDAAMVFGFDIDRSALELALQNVNNTFGDDDVTVSKVYGCCERFNFIQADIVSDDSDAPWESMSKKFDTIIMNPPFGTKQKQGLDISFLKRAINLAENVVYSLHKTSTRAVSFIIQFLSCIIIHQKTLKTSIQPS